jgi:hypothetical protein
MSLTQIARLLIILGVILLFVGGLIYITARYGFPLGNLPGDIRFKRGNFSCFIPLTTTILLSIVFTLLLNLIIRLYNR